MIKTIIATLILLTFPLLSHADASIYDGITIGVDADMSVSNPGDLDMNNSSTSANMNSNNDIPTYATSSTEVEIKNEGFFRRMINWFKGWFN
jgi:hypothetical protein